MQTKAIYMGFMQPDIGPDLPDSYATSHMRIGKRILERLQHNTISHIPSDILNDGGKAQTHTHSVLYWLDSSYLPAFCRQQSALVNM